MISPQSSVRSICFIDSFYKPEISTPPGQANFASWEVKQWCLTWLFGRWVKQWLKRTFQNDNCGGLFPTTLGFWAWTPNLLVFWVGLILQWEVQEVFLQVTDRDLTHLTLWVLAQPRWLPGSWAFTLKSKQDFFLPEMFFLILSCLSLPKFSNPFFLTFPPLFIPLS